MNQRAIELMKESARIAYENASKPPLSEEEKLRLENDYISKQRMFHRRLASVEQSAMATRIKYSHVRCYTG